MFLNLFASFRNVSKRACGVATSLQMQVGECKSGTEQWSHYQQLWSILKLSCVFVMGVKLPSRREREKVQEIQDAKLWVCFA